METSDIYRKYLESAVRFLGYRPRSEKEIRDNLVKKKASYEIIEKVIAWLKEKKFINDEEFAKWWIEHRARYRPKAMRVIEMELKQKGIGKEIIEIVKKRDDLETESETELAKKIVSKKILRYKNMEKQELYQKLGGLLARKGFDWETIKACLDSTINHVDD